MPHVVSTLFFCGLVISAGTTCEQPDEVGLLQAHAAVKPFPDQVQAVAHKARFASDFIVRYAAMQPQNNSEYVSTELLPMLHSSICLAEKNLLSSVQLRFGVSVKYVIFTDSFTHAIVATSLHSFGLAGNRIEIINLDNDPSDGDRMLPLKALGLDSVNYASVRRTLADSAHLPRQSARLLLGTDVSFLTSPEELLDVAANSSGTQAFYMKVRRSNVAPLYKILNYSGPQCAGLLGDFIYLPPGLEVGTDTLQEKMLWYAQQDNQLPRTEPQLDQPKSLHGIDQFGFILALALAVSPQGAGGCIPLSDRYAHDGSGSSQRTQAWVVAAEVAHDKVVSSCSLSP